MALDIYFEKISSFEAEILLAGVGPEGYNVYRDARIKTENNMTGVGPVAFTKITGDSSRNAILFFMKDKDSDEHVLSFFENVSFISIEATLADYVNANGGNITERLLLAPEVSDV